MIINTSLWHVASSEPVPASLRVVAAGPDRSRPHPQHAAQSPRAFFMAGYVPGTLHHPQHARRVCNDRPHAWLQIVVSLKKLHGEKIQWRRCFFIFLRGGGRVVDKSSPAFPRRSSGLFTSRHLRQRKHLTTNTGTQMPTVLMCVRVCACGTCAHLHNTGESTSTVYLLLLCSAWHLSTSVSGWQSL